MYQRSIFENAWNIQWLWIGILSFCLVSCSEKPSTATTEVVDIVAVRVSPSPESTTTPVPFTATSLLPSPTNTPTNELSTETPLPTEKPTITPIHWPTREVFFNGARVTFINNAGFLITVGDKKILIDALYETHNQNIDPPQEVVQRAANGEPPFDEIDLVIATHSHNDHFSSDLVREHLRNNEMAVFVSSQDAVRQILQSGGEFAERVIPVNLEPGERKHLSINGIELDCLYITHGIPPFLNIGVVITVDDYTFFHSGDMVTDDMAEEVVSLMDLQGYGLPQKEIDLAILPIQTFLVDEDVILIEEGVQARYVSPMHYPYQYPPTSVEDNFSNVVVFKDILESWVVPLE